MSYVPWMTRGGHHAGDLGEGARQARAAKALSRGHRGGRAGFRRGRAGRPALQRPPGRPRRERLLLLRGLQGPGRAGSSSREAALRRLARGGRYAGRTDGSDPLQARLPDWARLLGQAIARRAANRQRWDNAVMRQTPSTIRSVPRTSRLLSVSTPLKKKNERKRTKIGAVPYSGATTLTVPRLSATTFMNTAPFSAAPAATK